MPGACAAVSSGDAAPQRPAIFLTMGPLSGRRARARRSASQARYRRDRGEATGRCVPPDPGPASACSHGFCGLPTADGSRFRQSLLPARHRGRPHLSAGARLRPPAISARKSTPEIAPDMFGRAGQLHVRRRSILDDQPAAGPEQAMGFGKTGLVAFQVMDQGALKDDIRVGLTASRSPRRRLAEGMWSSPTACSRAAVTISAEKSMPTTSPAPISRQARE